MIAGRYNEGVKVCIKFNFVFKYSAPATDARIYCPVHFCRLQLTIKAWLIGRNVLVNVLLYRLQTTNTTYLWVFLPHKEFSLIQILSAWFQRAFNSSCCACVCVRCWKWYGQSTNDAMNNCRCLGNRFRSFKINHCRI